MAKTIKFNLICDNKPIRTIEDLQENFNIEDIYEYYKNGLLKRWLKVRGYSNYLEKVEKNEYTSPEEIIKELIKIFDIQYEEDKLETDLKPLNYKEELARIRATDQVTEKTIENYQNAYDNLIELIKKDKFDKKTIQEAIKKITTNYMWLFKLNHVNLFWDLFDNEHYLAIVCFLMYDETRKYYYGENKDYQPSHTKNGMYSKILEIIEDHINDPDEIDEILGKDNYHFLQGVNDDKWQPLGDTSKKHMIIGLINGGEVSDRVKKKDYSETFDIVEHAEYRGSYFDSQLCYMEI